MGRKTEKKAYAKVNLGLDIIGRREDGYHLVRMVMQQIGLCDVLTFEETEAPGVRLCLAEDCTIPDILNVVLPVAALVHILFTAYLPRVRQRW